MGRTWRFDGFEVDSAAHCLVRAGSRIRLREQSFQVLLLLLARAGQVVTREDLRHRLWADQTFVDFENSLNSVVGRLRAALGDSADRPRYIETLPRVGYRFIAAVTGGAPDTSGCAQPVTRLLVLPFVNSSGDPSLDYFSDAITDEIITELARLAPDLGVIARTTAMHYKGTPQDVADIARQLTLDWVVEGSVRWYDGRVALTIQLIRASDQTHVLVRRYEALLGDIFRMQRSAALAIGQQIGIVAHGRGRDEAPPVGSRAPKPPTQDLIAYNCYIQGRHHLERSQAPGSWASARTCLEAAVARDPRFALAHDGLAELWWSMGFFAIVAPREALPVGMSHARRAVEIDGSLAEAHAMLAQYQKQYAFDWAEVTREMTLALELDAASPIVRRRYATTGLMPFGRLDEAIHELEAALDLDPLGLFSRIWLVVLLWLNRQYDRGVEMGRELLEIEPHHFMAHLAMGTLLREARRFQEATVALRRASDLTGGSPLVLGWLGLTLAESGDADRARAILDRLGSMAARVYVPPTSQAWIHLGLGEVDEFFESMYRAIDARDHMITPIRSYPFLECIRHDGRYGDLLRRMNLA